MSPDALLIVAGVGVAALLIMILTFKVQPFVALLTVSIGVALAAGVPAADLVKTIEAGMGATLGHIAIIIALGAMIGRMIELSGGARALATSLMDRFGNRRIPLALTAAGFLLGVPVFFEVGVIILMPIAYGIARATKKPLLVYALPMCAAMLTVHAFLPPHPGAVAVAAALGIDLGRMLLFGLPITAVVCIVGWALASRMTRRVYAMDADVRAEVYGTDVTDEDIAGWAGASAGTAPLTAARDTGGAATTTMPPATTAIASPETSAAEVLAAKLPDRAAPSFSLILTLIVTPILLILAATLAESNLAEGSLVRSVLTVVGAPMVALLLDVALCGWLLGGRRGWSAKSVADVMASAVPGVAMVILIAGAGGVFGKVLVAGKIDVAISGLLSSSGLPLLAIAFLFTLLLRAIQGSATVALVTTAGIVAPLVQAGDYGTNRIALVALAMGAGALAMSHINDAGYWIVVRLTGLSVGAGLRTWTVLTTVCGVVGFALVSLVWTFV